MPQNYAIDARTPNEKMSHFAVSAPTDGSKHSGAMYAIVPAPARRTQVWEGDSVLQQLNYAMAAIRYDAYQN